MQLLPYYCQVYTRIRKVQEYQLNSYQCIIQKGTILVHVQYDYEPMPEAKAQRKTGRQTFTLKENPTFYVRQPNTFMRTPLIVLIY